MSTIQQLKNFIRHGKQARVANTGDDRKPEPQQQQPGPADPQKNPIPATAEPAGFQHADAQPATAPQPIPGAVPAAAGDGHHRAGQAGNLAAHEADQYQDRHQKAASAKKLIDEANIAKLVAEENELRSRFTKYPGLERYILLEKMGDGAFSNVYKARDTTGEYGEVAIKVVRKYEMNSLQGNRHLHPDFKKVPKAAERSNILKEVQIMRQLDHPNIVKLIDFSESRQYYYIVLELAPGGELFHQIVRLTYFSEELSRHVIVQVAQALEYLHEERGVVHRDIKPENILFNPIPIVPAKEPKPKPPGDEDKVDEGEFVPGVGAGGIGRIKIADFGLSKIVWDTQTMTPCGTVGYTAPEIVKDERYSKSVDMWALGCVLYTLLCGFPPFYDESIEVLTEKVAKGQYTFLSPWWDDISQSAQDLISHLLSVDPERRYTIREFLAHPWVHGSGPTPREERKQHPSADSLRAFDPSRIVDGGNRYDFRSPGAVNLREVFDVGYAVHRQEEEAKRRKQVGVKGSISARLLGGLNEEDEDEEDEAEAGGNSNEMDVDARAGNATNQSLEQRMMNANLGGGQGQGSEQQHERRGRERERAPAAAETLPVQPQNPAERGYGQHSPAVTAAARQQVRERNRQKGAFELNMDGATLLGRRGVKTPAASVGGA